MTRDTWIVGGALVAALLLGIGIYFFAPLQGPGSLDFEKVAAPFFSQSGSEVKVLAEGTTSNVSERKNYKVVTKEQFAEIWGMAYGDNAPEIPNIDFSKKEAFAIFAGTKPSGGYAISVKSVSDTATARNVAIQLSSPGNDCVVTQSLTSPFVIVEVAASDLPIQKNETTEVASCSAAGGQ